MESKKATFRFFQRKYFSIYLIIYFLILSVLMFWPLHQATYLYVGHDLEYHLTRIEELSRLLNGGGFLSFVSTYTANKIGIANNIFYPDLFLYLFAGIKFVIKDPVKAIYLGIGLINFLTFISSYFSYRSFSKSNLKAFIFANIYGLATYRYTIILVRFDLGEALALVFLPMVFLAFYKITYQKQYQYWKLLALSLAGVLYSHLLTFIIASVFLLLVFIFSIFKMEDLKSVIKSYFLAAGLFILLSLAFLVTFVKTYFSVPIIHPAVGKLLSRAYTVSALFDSTINNSLFRPYNLGLLSIIILLLAILRFRKLNVFNKWLLFISLGLILLTTKLFPWGYFQNTPLVTMQFPFRFFIIANLLIAVLGAEVFTQLNPKKVLLLLLPFLLLTSIANVQQFKTMKDRSARVVKHSKIPYERLTSKYKKFDNRAYYALINYGNHYNDYTPWPKGVNGKLQQKNFFKMTMHEYYNGVKKKRIKKIKSIPNGVVMPVKMAKKAKTALPFYLYGTKNYRLTINGKSAAVRINKYNSLLTSLKKGKNTVQIKYVPSLIQLGAIWISLLSLIGLIADWLLIFFKKNGKKAS